MFLTVNFKYEKVFFRDKLHKIFVAKCINKCVVGVTLLLFKRIIGTFFRAVNIYLPTLR